MLRYLVEKALASALSRAALEARFDVFVDRVIRAGALSATEVERLRVDLRARLVEVEAEGRELRDILGKALQGVVERVAGLGGGGDRR